MRKPPEFRRIFADERKFCIFGIKGHKLLRRQASTMLQKEHLVPMGTSAEIGLRSSFRFQHENDPKHTAEIAKLWLLYEVPNRLHILPQSPDLNPIEHVWKFLERRIRQHNIFSKNTLKRVLKGEREKLRTEETTRLVNAMPKRIQEILKTRSYSTSY
ncbi:transposable element Tcb1 transposase [Trichonephila clavipes]|nr:transposable element Tcb1 transposase [Trichonephila clavipes]